ncbi:MAG: 1-acyl-sn-glycerol-3-phosphate acyltransferase [Ruminococcus sp.]|nr:1-acyl-sn-glycerol-3-phosphate acyltransferase [Ruminococcus sp.]
MSETTTNKKEKTKKDKAKKKKWMKLRHRIVRNLAYMVLYPYSKIKYGITIEKNKDTKHSQYLILMNHQTAFDQFFLGMAFKETIYYVASEDLFSNGFVSKLITYIVAPIPIKKQTTDVHAILNCMRVAKEGGSIAIAPEGNRTYAGENVYINPAIAKLAKKLGLPVAFYRLEGGYGVHPRWSDVIRKGKMRGYVSRVLTPDELKSMPDDELNALIREELYQNDCTLKGEFKHKKSAEYMERAFYVCPDCGLTEFESCGDIVKCKKCEKEIRYLPDLKLQGVGFDFPFEHTCDWYSYQCDFVNKLDTREYTEKPLFEDNGVKFSEVILYKNKKLISKNASIKLFGDKVLIEAVNNQSLTIPFEEASAFVVLGKNKLNIYYNGKVYQLKGSNRFNALKYVNLCYRHKNISEEKSDDKFLGL